MSPPPSSPPPAPEYVIPERLWAWLGAPRARAAVVWLIVLVLGASFLYRALTWFDNQPHLPAARHRADGNGGHAQIDFGGQWVMGRMLVTGNGRHLYHR
ncbi:MAG: hypothetical protein ACKODX_18990, partial [Gemmata sp.]